MLLPKRVKYRKQMRGRMRGKAMRGAEVQFGEFGLQALEPGWVSAREIEAARRAIVRATQRRGKVWIRIFPDKPVTQRAAETRMGKGKGEFSYWATFVKKNKILFELDGPFEDELFYKVLQEAASKIGIKTKIVFYNR